MRDPWSVELNHEPRSTNPGVQGGAGKGCWGVGEGTGLTRDFWQSGSHQTAWTTLLHEFQRLRSSLPVEDQLRIGIDLSTWMRAENQMRFAVEDVLQPLESLAAGLPRDVPIRREFLTFFALSSISAGIYPYAVQRTKAALQETKDATVREELQAALAEFLFLQGEFSQVQEMQA